MILKSQFPQRSGRKNNNPFLLRKILIAAFLCFINIIPNPQLIAERNDFVASPPPLPRNIYIDLGAFRGETLRMFMKNEVPTRCHPGVDWEVFAFEACPILAHCTQLRVDSLNNLSIDPPISYSDIPGLQELVKSIHKNQTPFTNELRLLFEDYETLLFSRISSRGPYEAQFSWSPQEREAQLKTAEARLPFTGTQYTAYAMAVGDKDTTLEMHWHCSNNINGGGNLLGIYYGAPSHIFTVPVLRLSRWLKQSFSNNDYIYIKMDIEGMEFLLIEDLIATGCLEMIKEMDVEWHGRFNVPGREKEQELRKIITESGIILRDHH